MADQVNEFKQIFITSIVLGELNIGLNRIANKPKHHKRLNDFLQFCTVLKVDETTAHFYGEVVSELYKKGRPIPTNDIWIAASVKQYDLVLITKDKHFKEIEGLTIKDLRSH